jgi:hypothetical protein
MLQRLRTTDVTDPQVASTWFGASFSALVARIFQLYCAELAHGLSPRYVAAPFASTL